MIQSRQTWIITFILLLATTSSFAQYPDPAHWSQVDRVWVGPEYWANRLQDWELRGGRLVCLNDELPYRTVHILTRRLSASEGSLEMSIDIRWPREGDLAEDASAGFLIGAGASDLDYRAAAIIHSRTGSDGGYYAGINQHGELFIASHQDLEPQILGTSSSVEFGSDGTLSLSLTGQTMIVRAIDTESGSVVGDLEVTIPDGDLSGSLALVVNKARVSFGNWSVSGSRLEIDENRHMGPIVSTKYTVSEGIMTMTAQFMPLGDSEIRVARLQVLDDGRWTDVALGDIASPDYVAVFRLRDWNQARERDYRVQYDLRLSDGSDETYAWSGTVRQDPVFQGTITVAAFTGNHNTWSGFEGQGPYAFDTSHLWFPHNNIVDHVRKQAPDLLFFSGDQVYEGASPTRADRSSIMLDYLYKWYLYCWAYRELTRDIPTVVIPDDHDVYQGNVWGEGGRKTDRDHNGGYVHDADFIRLVEKTQTANLPPPVDPRPIDQGIGVYFTSLKWGRIGFAIIEDRKFKSGPAGRILDAASGRPDHINNQEYDTRLADVPGVTLLGERQLEFLEDFAADWRGEDMKAVLSQTVFAGMATHHGADLFRLIADLDSNGWPQTGRRKALSVIRKGYALMIAGDQHLSTVVHHGIDVQNDAGVSFAVPSIANFYPRGWMPETEGANRPAGSPGYMGEHLDGFQNPVNVLAVYNPPGLTGTSTGIEPLLLNDRAPGYGIIRFNKAQREMTIENWPRHMDPEATNARQYDTWPIKVKQEDNYGREAVAFLPTVEVSGMKNPVIQIFDESTGDLVYALRIRGGRFRPKVFDADVTYSLRVGNPERDNWQVIEGVEPLLPSESAILPISFL